MKQLSICILAFNKWAFTKSCLNDLSKLPNDHEIILFDNGSTDETKQQLENNKEIVYIRSEENLGFSKGCNRAYAVSQANNVMFLNNDIRVKNNFSDWTKEIIELCPKGLVGPTMGELDKDFNFIKEANQLLTSKYSYMSGWCLSSSKEIWNKLDLSKNEIFSEDYFCYFDDTDLSFRSKKLNISFQIVDIPVVHFGKVSSKQLNTYQLYKNAKETFIKKWK